MDSANKPAVRKRKPLEERRRKSFEAAGVPTELPDNREEERRVVRDARAHNLEHRSAAAYLSGLIGNIFDGFEPDAFESYVDGILQAAGDPQDPFVKMAAEQLILVHHCLGRICVRTSEASSPQEIQLYVGSVTRLMAEYRRTFQALQDTPTAEETACDTSDSARKTPDRVHQNGHAGSIQKSHLGTKLANNRTGKNGYINRFTESPPSNGRSSQPQEAGSFDA